MNKDAFNSSPSARPTDHVRFARAWTRIVALVVVLVAIGAAAGAQETDTDGDTMPDAWETFFGLNPTDATDATGDPDGDGLTNAQEFAAGRHPVGRHARYFAEGSTGFFDTSVSVLNLSATDTAHVALALVTDAGTTVSHPVELGPHQRQSVSINTALGVPAAVSIIVESDVPVAADRSMTWGPTGVGLSLDSGSPAPATTWYFAEGATGPFLLYYLFENPGATPATVGLRYLLEGGPPVTTTHVLPPYSRTTIFVNAEDPALAVASFGAVVSSDVPILAERAMYVDHGGTFGGGAASAGSPQLSTDWYFGEGSTGPFFHCFLSVLNPGLTAATATVTYHLSDGSTATQAYDVPAEGRRTVYFNGEAAADPALAALATGPVWFTVSATQPILGERAMWWSAWPWYEAHAAPGSTTSALSWAVPDGRYGGETYEHTYVLIGNTTTTAGQVRLTLIPETGAASTREVPIAAGERLTLDVGALFGLTEARFSVLVDSLGAPAVPLAVDYARYRSVNGVPFSGGGAAPAIPVPAVAPPPGPPTLASVSPNQGIQGTTVAVILTGTNFVAGATTVNVSGSGVTVTNVVVGSSTSLAANLVLDAAAAEGPRSVTVTTAGGTSGGQTFTITQPPPTLTTVSPNQGVRGSTVAVMLTGTGFVAGATTVTVGGSGVTVTNVAVSSGTSLTADFVIDPTAPDGFRTVRVTTAGGTSGPRIFMVTLPPPTLTSVTPNEGIPGTTVAVTLTGTNFVVGATTVAVAVGGVTVTDVAASSETSLTANFVVDPAAATGPRSVTVTTAAGTSGPQTFTINLPPTPPAPTLTSVSPNQGLRGSTVAVTLTGTDFVVGATTVTVAGGGVMVTNVVVGSTTSLTANFVLDPAAVVGPRSVTVTTAGGTSNPQGFTIGPPPPTLTSVAPNQGIRGTAVAVTLTGTNFAVGATTVAVAGGGVTVADVTVGSATSLTASLVLDPTAAEGPRTVTVTTAGGTSGPQTFTIALPPPTLTSVSPSQGIRGTTVAVTLTGTDFVVGATTVAVAGGGVTVNNVVVGSSTSLTANFVLDLAAAGFREVTVTTAGGTSGAQIFLVSLPPPSSVIFQFTGGDQTFTVPAGVVSITIVATGAQGGLGFGTPGGGGGLGGRTTATLSVTPGATLTVRVGGVGPNGAPPPSATAGGFNGGGGSEGNAGGGGGASSVRDGATPLVIAGGGGAGGAGGATVGGGDGGAGGGLIANFGRSVSGGGGGGGGGRETMGGFPGLSQGLNSTNGTAGAADQGGVGGALIGGGAGGGGGGGGGYFGGGGGGGGEAGGGGGGGSSFTAPGATGVVHEQGVKASHGFLRISW